MIDIVNILTDDLQMADSSVRKAENVVATQLGKLTYAPDFGVDLRYFLNPDFQFENEAFKSYILQRLAEASIDVATVTETVETLYSENTFNLLPDDQGDGLVR